MYIFQQLVYCICVAYQSIGKRNYVKKIFVLTTFFLIRISSKLYIFLCVCVCESAKLFPIFCVDMIRVFTLFFVVEIYLLHISVTNIVLSEIQLEWKIENV